MPRFARAAILALLLISAACRPLQSPQEQLQAAVVAAHREAAPAMLELAQRADREAAALKAQGWSEESGRAVAAAQRYAELVRAGAWHERLLPILREAVDSYIRLREVLPQLPALPAIVLELLLPCSCPPAPELARAQGPR